MEKTGVQQKKRKTKKEIERSRNRRFEEVHSCISEVKDRKIWGDFGGENFLKFSFYFQFLHNNLNYISFNSLIKYFDVLMSTLLLQ